jgi:hypothetical protein
MEKEEDRRKFGYCLMGALTEVQAHRRGEIALPARLVNMMSTQRMKTIFASLAKSPQRIRSPLYHFRANY